MREHFKRTTVTAALREPRREGQEQGEHFRGLCQCRKEAGTEEAVSSRRVPDTSEVRANGVC